MRGLPGGASSVKFLKLVSGADVLTAAEHKTFVGAFAAVKRENDGLSKFGDATSEALKVVCARVNATSAQEGTVAKTLKEVARHAQRCVGRLTPAEHKTFLNAFVALNREKKCLSGLDAVTLANWRAVLAKINATSTRQRTPTKTLLQVKRHARRCAVPFGFTEGSCRWQIKLVSGASTATGTVHPAGTAVTQGRETRVRGVLKAAFGGNGAPKVVVETTATAEFVVGVDLVVGSHPKRPEKAARVAEQKVCARAPAGNGWPSTAQGTVARYHQWIRQLDQT